MTTRQKRHDYFLEVVSKSRSARMEKEKGGNNRFVPLLPTFIGFFRMVALGRVGVVLTSILHIISLKILTWKK